MKSRRTFFLLVTIIFFISSCTKGNDVKVINSTLEDQKEETPVVSLFAVSEGILLPEMIYVEGGEFIMGDEYVQTNQPHPVTLSPFYISKYMVTNGEWKQFLDDVELEFSWDWDDGVGYGPFYNIVPTDDCPAQGLNWYYAIIFCNWVSLKDGLEPCYEISKLPEIRKEDIEVNWNKDANGYRLPTDAEWEYAARGGQLSEGYLYPGSNDPNDIGKFGKGNKSSYPVGQYNPNELGIYDMSGNADEWCWDWYDEIMFEWLPEENPSVNYQEDVRKKSRYGYDFKVTRGAAWNSKAIETSKRGTYRPMNIAMTGIRLVRNVSE